MDIVNAWKRLNQPLYAATAVGNSSTYRRTTGTTTPGGSQGRGSSLDRGHAPTTMQSASAVHFLTGNARLIPITQRAREF